MDKRVEEQFSARAQGYNAGRRLIIPDFDEYYRTTADALHFEGPAPRVLDLGAGTGLSSEFLLARYPEAQLTLVDFSEAMLQQARERFADTQDVRYVVGDYREVPDVTAADEAGSYDVVISGLSIHHLSHAEKQALFSRIVRLLKPGGEFVNADLVLGADEALEELMQARIHDFLQGRIDEAGLARYYASQQIDDPAPVGEQLLWLKQAGFTTVDCLYRRWVQAVFYARV